VKTIRNDPALPLAACRSRVEPAEPGSRRGRRNHQGLDNRLITSVAAPVNENADPASPIARRERLGGLLSYDYRGAA
jgi:hypothetical protein